MSFLIGYVLFSICIALPIVGTLILAAPVREDF